MQHRRSCPVRDKIMRRYDQELLGAPLWCMTQQEEGLWIQGVNVMVPQRRVFVCASELALDESLTAGELDCFSAHIRLREPGKSKDKADNTESARALNRIAKAMYGSYSLSFHRSRRTAPENIEVLKQVVERGKEERQVQRGSAT
ncbi:hypothetical protein BHE74_00043617 [Ensete ventricosum]|nr:hypothetical protein BHE74_00043617 [Ensete ventricosum]